MAKQGAAGRRRRKKRSRQRTLRFYDFNLVFLVIFLVVIGLIMIFSATAYNSKDATNFFIRQVIYAVVGVAAMIGVSFIPYQLYRGLSEYGIFIAAILILLVLTPLGYSSHGATRWLKIAGDSLTIQPAEKRSVDAVWRRRLFVGADFDRHQ